MTVLVGVLCGDGVVMVGDGAASFAPSGAGLESITIKQSCKKLVRVSDKQMLGTSGSVALSQAFTELIRACSVENVDQGQAANAAFKASPKPDQYNKKTWTKESVRRLWSETIYNQAVAPGLNRANAIIQVSGNRNHQMDVMQTSLFAFVETSSQKAQLCLITPSCQLEHATEHLPIYSAGSGQMAADPFFAFLRGVFCPEGPISLQDGKLLAYWTVDLVIRVNPGLVGLPIQMMMLHQTTAKDWTVSEATQGELDTHQRMVGELETKLRSQRKLLAEGSGDQGEEIPTPPKNG